MTSGGEVAALPRMSEAVTHQLNFPRGREGPQGGGPRLAVAGPWRSPSRLPSRPRWRSSTRSTPDSSTTLARPTRGPAPGQPILTAASGVTLNAGQDRRAFHPRLDGDDRRSAGRVEADLAGRVALRGPAAVQHHARGAPVPRARAGRRWESTCSQGAPVRAVNSRVSEPGLASSRVVPATVAPIASGPSGDLEATSGADAPAASLRGRPGSGPARPGGGRGPRSHRRGRAPAGRQRPERGRSRDGIGHGRQGKGAHHLRRGRRGGDGGQQRRHRHQGATAVPTDGALLLWVTTSRRGGRQRRRAGAPREGAARPGQSSWPRRERRTAPTTCSAASTAERVVADTWPGEMPSATPSSSPSSPWRSERSRTPSLAGVEGLGGLAAHPLELVGRTGTGLEQVLRNEGGRGGVRNRRHQDRTEQGGPGDQGAVLGHGAGDRLGHHGGRRFGLAGHGQGKVVEGVAVAFDHLAERALGFKGTVHPHGERW